MLPEPADAPLTRAEFHRTLVPVWFFLAALTAAPLLRPMAEWTQFLPAAIALLAGLLSAAAAGGGRGQAGWDAANPPAEPSEQVRQIARDPSRKIEAIKLYRDETGAGLAVAKRAVEQAMAEDRRPG